MLRRACWIAAAVAFCVLVGGCAVRFTELSHGMSQAEVTEVLGPPSVRRTDGVGRPQWIYFDVPLDEPPRLDRPEGRERLRLRLAEKNPAFFRASPSSYKMTLFLSFDGAGRVVASRTMVRETGTLFPPPGSRR